MLTVRTRPPVSEGRWFTRFCSSFAPRILAITGLGNKPDKWEPERDLLLEYQESINPAGKRDRACSLYL